MMRRSILAATLVLGLPAFAFAQVTTPAPKVQPSSVPADSVLSYNLIGLKIANGGNESVGEIKDLVIEHGALVGYVLSVGGFLGLGEHYVSVTPSSIAIKYDEPNKTWHGTINATKDELKSVPEFKYDGKFKH